MAKKLTVDLGMFVVQLPMVPNFIRLDGFDSSMSVGSFTDEALRKIGAAWTEALIAHAAERRKGA